MALTDVRMSDEFDGAKEPMRALRDLISACEGIFGDDNGEQAILGRAQAGFTALRKLFGDTRPADQIADREAMIEPSPEVAVFLTKHLTHPKAEG